MPADEPGRPRRSRATKWLVAGVVALGAVVAVGVLVVWGGRRKLARIEGQIRSSGAALHAREIVFDGPDTPPEADQAVARLATALDEAPDVRSVLRADPEELQAALEWGPAAGASSVLREFAGESTPDGPDDGGDPLFDTWSRLGAGSRSEDGGARDRRIVQIAAALSEPHLALVEDVCAQGRTTFERRIGELAPGEMLPAELLHVYLASVRMPINTLPALLGAGRVAEAEERLRLAWRASQRWRGAPYLIGFLAWAVGTNEVLAALEHALPELADAAALADVERELRALDVVRDERRALEGERALGNDVFDALERGQPGSAGRPSLLGWLYFVHDRAFYLDALTESVRRTELPYGEFAARPATWIADLQSWRSLHRASIMLLPKTEPAHATALQIQARARLAIVALVAHDEGRAAAIAAAAGLVDPFDGAPLRTRSESDGDLTIWSVGVNLVDEGGSTTPTSGVPADDVWRVRPR